MIRAAVQADVALLIVPADKAGFEASMGDQGRTRQHAQLCHLLGIEQLIVGINKMDSESYKWSDAQYRGIQADNLKMMAKIGYVVHRRSYPAEALCLFIFETTYKSTIACSSLRRSTSTLQRPRAR